MSSHQHQPPAMPNTNRPFLSGFLTAFRAQSAWQKAATPPTTTSVTAEARTREYSHQHHASSSTTSTHNPSTPTSTSTSPPTATATAPRTISKPTAGAHSTTTTAFPSTRTPSYPKSPASPTSPPSTTTPSGFPPFSPSKQQRRGSDSSSEGFREGNLGAEKWYIGGRTAAGEERFYKLGMVKRARSIDRLSLDRLSL